MPQARADLWIPAPKVCRRYRPRQQRASPVWQVLKDHWPAWVENKEAGRLAKGGPLSWHLLSAVTAFLGCGDLRAGFTRLRYPDRAHEYLLAFTSKPRGLCAACDKRRVLTEAAFIADEVCAAVPHRHPVFTVPRLLRGLFREQPALLWHPQVHVLATAGVFDADRAFHPVPVSGRIRLRELWRHAVLSRLREAWAVEN